MLLGSRRGGRCRLRRLRLRLLDFTVLGSGGLLCFEEQEQGLVFLGDGTCSGFHSAIVEDFVGSSLFVVQWRAWRLEVLFAVYLLGMEDGSWTCMSLYTASRKCTVE